MSVSLVNGGCSSCPGTVQLGVLDRVAVWVNGATVPCVNCGGPVDVWREIVSQAKEPLLRLVLVARTAAFRMPVPTAAPGGFFELDLTKHGVPDGSTVYNLVITPEHSDAELVTIVESVQMHRPWPNRQTTLYMGLWPTGMDPVKVGMSVLVSWSEPDAETFAWRRLTEAFTHLGAGRVAEAVLAANVAIEHSVDAVLDQAMPVVVGTGSWESFTASGTYSQLLNVVLPLWLRATGASPLPEDVVASLKHLRKARNDVAHGNDGPGLDEATAARLLAGAAFGTAYLQTL